MYQKAVSAGYKVTDAEVQAEFAKLSKNFASDAEMNRTLAERGMDRDALVKELQRTLIVGKYIQENIAKKIAVTPAEVSDYYGAHTEEFRHPDMIRTSHILILVPAGAPPEQDKAAEKRAAALLERAKKGEDFARLAKENSMDASASQGGDIGLTPKGQLAPEYEAAAFALQIGQISGVVRTQFGYHIIKLTEKKGEGIATLDEIRSDLTQFLKNKKTEEEMSKVVDQLRQQGKISIYISLGKPPEESKASSPRP